MGYIHTYIHIPPLTSLLPEHWPCYSKASVENEKKQLNVTVLGEHHHPLLQGSLAVEKIAATLSNGGGE